MVRLDVASPSTSKPAPRRARQNIAAGCVIQFQPEATKRRAERAGLCCTDRLRRPAAFQPDHPEREYRADVLNSAELRKRLAIGRRAHAHRVRASVASGPKRPSTDPRSDRTGVRRCALPEGHLRLSSPIRAVHPVWRSRRACHGNRLKDGPRQLGFVAIESENSATMSSTFLLIAPPPSLFQSIRSTHQTTPARCLGGQALYLRPPPRPALLRFGGRPMRSR